jgi:hypothetical protein
VLSLRLFEHLLRRHRSKPAHNLQILLLAHLLVALAYLGKDLEVVDVEGGCEGVEELRLFICCIREGVWCADRHCNVVADVCVMLGAVGGVEAYHALRHEESFVVHLVPVGWWAGGVWGQCELGIVRILYEMTRGKVWEGRTSAEPMRLSVLEPSSMILQVMWPSLRISPDFAETKLMGRRGIFMLAIACRASSSIVS